MAWNKQPTNFYTADGQNSLVIHNGDFDKIGGFTGKSSATTNDIVPQSAIAGGKLTYTGALGTFSGVALKPHH